MGVFCRRRPLINVLSTGTLKVEGVEVHGPLPTDRDARAFWTWVEVALSLSRGEQTTNWCLRFRIPWMSSSGTFLIGGWNYTPVVQLVPAPGLVVRAYDTPSRLARNRPRRHHSRTWDEIAVFRAP